MKGSRTPDPVPVTPGPAAYYPEKPKKGGGVPLGMRTPERSRSISPGPAAYNLNVSTSSKKGFTFGGGLERMYL